MTTLLRPAATARFEDLLSKLPDVRRVAVRAYSKEGLDVPRAWAQLIDFLRAADRPADDLVIVEQLARQNEESAPTSEQLAQVLEVLERTAFDLREGLEHAVPPDELVPVRLRKRRDAYLAEMLAGSGPTRAVHLRNLKSFIYEHPGLYLRDIYRRMSRQGLVFYSYPTLCNYVEELADEGSILTIGRHQGIPRYCFPHPDRIQRIEYYGRPFPVKGEVEGDLTDRFALTGAFVKVFLVNSEMRPVAMITPMAAPLKTHDSVEGFGKVQGTDFLGKRLHLKAVAKLPEDVHEVVMVEHLRRQGAEEEIRIPPEFARLAR